MSRSRILLDSQAIGRVFTFGTTSASGESLITINNGTAAATNVVLDVKGSQNIAGDLNLIGNLNISGSINETNVTNLSVKDVNIQLNVGGTNATAAGAGLYVEGSSAAVVAKLLWDGSKWVAGDGTTQYEIVNVSTAQTLTSKTLNNTTFTGTVTGLSTSSVTEGSNKYFTEPRVLATTLTGYAAGTNTSISATDTVLQAVQKLQAQVDAKASTTVYFKAATVTGTQDGSNKTFTIGSAVATGSEQVFVNGQLMNPGSANDYVISGTSVTFQAAMFAPASTDVVRVYGVY